MSSRKSTEQRAIKTTIGHQFVFLAAVCSLFRAFALSVIPEGLETICGWGNCVGRLWETAAIPEGSVKGLFSPSHITPAGLALLNAVSSRLGVSQFRFPRYKATSLWCESRPSVSQVPSLPLIARAGSREVLTGMK